MGETSDDIKLPKDSEIEVSRLPGNILQTTGNEELQKTEILYNFIWPIGNLKKVLSKAESELLCRAYAYLYLGDDPFDKEAKENFGISLLSLFQKHFYSILGLQEIKPKTNCIGRKIAQ